MSQSKFINIPLPLVSATAALPTKIAITNSSTTTAAAAGKLTDTGGTPNFSDVVQVGDIIFPTGAASTVYSTVTAIDSTSVLSISGTGNTLLEASGQAYEIYAQADAYAVSTSPGSPNVKVGDIVINTTTGVHGTVTEVVSNRRQNLDAILFNNNSTDAVVIISVNGKGGRLVSLNNLAMSLPTAGGAGTTPVVLKYKKAPSVGTATVTISAVQDAYSYQLAFEKLMVEVLEADWTNIVRDMPVVTAPVGATVPLLYATDVTIS